MEKILSEKLAEFICSNNYDTFPEEVTKKAELCICDYIGCIYAGTTLPIHQKLVKMVEETFPSGQSRIIGTNIKADPVTAAFVNGATASNMALDDMFKVGIYHPAVISVTTALAIAGTRKISGKEIIAAVILGYEISNRISEFCNPSHYKYWHTSATVGCFCAAVVASKLLNCTVEETINALGLAGTQAAGSQECNGNDAQFLHLGFASRSGVMAALLAKNGLTGAKHILEGPAGYFSAMTKYEGRVEDIFADLGKRFTILENTFKVYPCCGHTFASIDGGLVAREKYKIDCKEIASVQVGTYQTALSNSGNPNPKNVQEAQFSIPYSVSSALVKGEFGIKEFETWPPKAEIMDVMKKVVLVHDDFAEEQFPAARGAEVKVTMKDGTVYTERRLFRKGDPEWPLTKEEVMTKFRVLMSYAVDEKDTQKVENALMQLVELDDIEKIII